ncbi:MAG: DUF4174 domain-containing protein [Ahrensia sp.]|nr:DUF4174 domain-containing protein [Ahrensia sp.]
MSFAPDTLAKARAKSYLAAMRLALASIVVMLASTFPAAAADPLAGLQWEARPLLLFAKSRSDASLDKQIDLLRERRPDLRERQMVVFRTAGNEDTRAAIGYVDLPRGAARSLRRRFEPRPNGLTVILVGKDGTEKGRWERVVEPDEIFELVDSMPMRQREAQGQSATTN